MIHHVTPFANDKNLGRAYNDAMSLIPDGHWACIRDYDVLFLLPDTCERINRYVEAYPDTALFTCFCNRIHPLSHQLYFKEINDNPDISFHIEIAKSLRAVGLKTTPIYQHLSGFLMVIKKETWLQFKFKETGGCVGVDTDIWRRLVAAGKKILRMDSVYVWHTYRMFSSVKDSSHLK